MLMLAMGATAQPYPLKTSDIRVRDPFIYADQQTATYYLYAQAENRRSSSGYQDVEIYASANLTDWAAPQPVLTLPASQNVSMVWAPEMHAYTGAYYLFVTLTFHTTLAGPPPCDAKNWPPLFRRGMWVFRADAPTGPFKPDLSDVAGEPFPLFRASDAPGFKTGAKEGKVTDGPFLYKSPKRGALFMIWSTFIRGHGYRVMQTRSESGRVTGPWKNHTPLYTQNGGHGMIFTDFGGRLLLALHQPNTGPMERLHLMELADDGATLKRKATDK